MRVVAGDDGHRVDGGVGQHGGHVGRGLGKARLLTMDYAIDAARRNDGVKLRPCRLERRNQHARGIVARANAAQHRALRVKPGVGC